MNRNSEAQDRPVTPGNGVRDYFGRELRKQREARGWSRRKLAAKSGISVDTIKQIEYEKRGSRQETRTKLEGALEMSLAGLADKAASSPHERGERHISRRITVTITIEE